MAISIDDSGVTIVTHVGCVLDKYERNGYDDSDFYAIVYDWEQHQLQHIEYATTRGWTYNDSATIDAIPEVLELATDAWTRAAISWAEYQQIKAAKWPEIGRKCKVIRGRKHKGTIAIVTWIGETRYTHGRDLACKMLTDAGEEFWVTMSYLEVCEPEQYLQSYAELAKQIRFQGSWRIAAF